MCFEITLNRRKSSLLTTRTDGTSPGSAKMSECESRQLFQQVLAPPQLGTGYPLRTDENMSSRAGTCKYPNVYHIHLHAVHDDVNILLQAGIVQLNSSQIFVYSHFETHYDTLHRWCILSIGLCFLHKACK